MKKARKDDIFRGSYQHAIELCEKRLEYLREKRERIDAEIAVVETGKKTMTELLEELPPVPTKTI